MLLSPCPFPLFLGAWVSKPSLVCRVVGDPGNSNSFTTVPSSGLRWEVSMCSAGLGGSWALVSAIFYK